MNERDTNLAKWGTFMQVLVADNLIKQTKDKRMPSSIAAQIYKELLFYGWG